MLQSMGLHRARHNSVTKWVLQPDLVLGAEGSSGGCQVFT